MNPILPQDVNVPTVQLIGRLLRLIRRHLSGIGKGIMLGIFGSMIGLAAPLFTRILVDSVYPTHDFALLNVIVAAVGAFQLGAAFIGILRGLYSQLVLARVSASLELMLFNHLQHLPFKFFDEHQIGEVLSRLGDARNSITSISKAIETFAFSGSYVVLLPPILFWMDWRLATLSMLSTPLSSILTVVVGRALRPVWTRSAQASAKLSSMQIDSLSNIRTIKLSAAEQPTFVRLYTQAQLTLKLQLNASVVSAISSAAQATIKAASTIACTWYGWTLVLRNEMTLGEFLAFSAYVGMLSGPVAGMSSLLGEFQRIAVPLSRMFEYLDVIPDSDPMAVQTKIARPFVTPVVGEFEVRNVTFAYAADRAPVLRDIKVSFPSGSSTAIVGASGAGKSTLLRLLAGVDTPNHGSIFLDGRSLSSFQMRELRNQVSVVWQETGIIRGTIRENLTLGCETVAQSVIEQAMSICRFDAFVKRLPLGLETTVAESGVSLSAGERQRLALSRALIRSTQVLLLDEATSAVDSVQDTLIFNALLDYYRTRTLVFVTHRLSSAALADQICVVHGSAIVAFGSHAKLLEESEIYRQMTVS